MITKKALLESIRHKVEVELMNIPEFLRDEVRPVAMAYCDKLDSLTEEEAYSNQGRKLQFRGKYNNKNLFCIQCAFAAPHENFKESTAGKITTLFGPDAQYRLAREYSVTVYVKLPGDKKYTAKELKDIMRCLKADDVSVKNKVVRLWWD